MPKKICVHWSLQQLLKIKYQGFKGLLNTNIIIYMATVGNKLSPKDPCKTPLEKYKLKNTLQASTRIPSDLYFITNFILCQKQVEAASLLYWDFT